MKKRSVKRGFTTALAAALVMASLTGCAVAAADVPVGSAQNDEASDRTGRDTEAETDAVTEASPLEKGSDTKELREVTFVLDWTPNTNHTGIYAADALGYYEEKGIKINIVQPPEDGATMMVASGQAQFGVDFQDYLAKAFTAEDEIPVTVVAAILQHNTSGIISLKEDGIDSPKGLEGKNYATWDMPIEKAMLENIVTMDGGDYSRVNLIPEMVTDEAAALQQNIDAIWVYYAWAGIACELAGLDTNMWYFKDINPDFDFYSPVIITNNVLIEDDPELIRDFLEATAKGYEYAIADPEGAADLLCEAVPELDPELVHESQEWISGQYKAEAEQWGYIDGKRWDAFYKWLSDNGLNDEIPEGYGFTNEYLK